MGERLNKIIATVAGVGYLPLAPGTWAAALATIAWYFLSQNFPEFYFWQPVLFVLISIAGIYTSGKMITENIKDPTHVVIDEVAGMLITLLYIPPTIFNFTVGFFLFRFFDILKPFGIRRAEKMHKGWGIMSDDILAGIYSTIILRAIIYLK
jgi:phosphatidylglycerophosphatase A